MERDQHQHRHEFGVTPEAFGLTEATRNMPTRLDSVFPEPEPKVPTVEYLQKLGCPEGLIPLVRELNDPWKLQQYVNSHLVYDHSDDTRGFVSVARDGIAHCFEGALFIYTVLELNGWNPRLVLLQADNKFGEDHNIIIYRHKNHLGSVAMSNWQTLKAKPPVFNSLHDLIAFGYWDAYTSEVPGYEGVHNLVGYTDPIDLVKKFGRGWFFREGNDAELPIFERYARGAVCTHLFTGERYKYHDEEFINDPSDDEAAR